MNKFEELLKIASNPDIVLHQQVHTEVLRQLVDAAQISNHPFNFKPRYEKEVDFK